MADFLSTFVFIIPGIMAYFWLQAFGLNPSVKHTAPELSGIAAMLWLPVSFITLLVLNVWSYFDKIDFLSVDKVWTVEAFNKATLDIKYLVLFLFVNFVVSFLICWIWSLWGHNFLRTIINHVRKSRGIATMSSSASVWEEFFIKINNDSKVNIASEEDNDSAENEETCDNEDADETQDPDVNVDNDDKTKKAVLIVHKIDNPKEFIVGSMTKASRPFEVDKALVLEDTEQWMNSIKNVYDYQVIRTYIDIKSGMVVKEIDPNKRKAKTIPEDTNI